MGRSKAYVDELFEEAEAQGNCLCAADERMAQCLRRRKAQGDVLCLAPRVFARKSYWNDLCESARAIHLMKALGETHPHEVFSHTSAALAYGLQVPWRIAFPLHSVVPERSHSRSLNNLIRHGRASVSPIVFDGVRVTTPEQTVADCLQVLELPDALAVADSALRTGLLSEDAVIEAAESLKGKPGYEHAVQVARLADGRSANGGESIARAALLEIGCKPPDLQRKFTDPLTGQTYYGDFFWECDDGTTVLGELDGYDKYFDATMTQGKTPEEVMAEERMRESHLTAVVDRVMRFRFADALNPVELAKLCGVFGVPMGYEPPLVLKHPSLRDGISSRRRS